MFFVLYANENVLHSRYVVCFYRAKTGNSYLEWNASCSLYSRYFGTRTDLNVNCISNTRMTQENKCSYEWDVLRGKGCRAEASECSCLEISQKPYCLTDQMHRHLFWDKAYAPFVCDFHHWLCSYQSWALPAWVEEDVISPHHTWVHVLEEKTHDMAVQSSVMSV